MKTIVKKAPLRKTLSKKREVKIPITRIESEKAFWVNFGPIIHSLEELLIALRSMDDKTFRHHVTKNRNDFASWVNDVLREGGLAKKLQACDSKTCCTTTVGRHIRVHF